MRLKEPLFGIRVAGLHPVIHFCFAVNMILFETNLYKYQLANLKDGGQQELLSIPNDQEKFNYVRWSNFEPLDFYDRAKRSLKEIDLSGQDEEVLSASEGGHDDAKIKDLVDSQIIFYAFFMVHILTAILNVTTYILRKRKKSNIALEWFQRVPLTLIYILLIMYEIFRHKLLSPDDRAKQLNDEMETWFFQEIGMFVFWLISTSVFLLFVNLTKYRSIWQANEEKMNLDTIWNMKNSMDALHYMYFEASTFNVAMAMCLQHLVGILQQIIQVDMDASRTQDGNWHQVAYNTGPCILLFIIRCMLAFALISQFGQSKNTLFGECPYTAWTIYLGIAVTTYLGLVYWFYTRDNSSIKKFTFVLIQADLINIPIVLAYYLHLFFWTKNKKIEIQQLQSHMQQKREQLFKKRIGGIENKFLQIHHRELVQKDLIPAIEALEVETKQEMAAKNKYDIFLNTEYVEAVDEMKKKYFSGHYICQQLHLMLVEALEILEEVHGLDPLIRDEEKVEEELSDEVIAKIHRAKVNNVALIYDADSQSGSSGAGTSQGQRQPKFSLNPSDNFQKAPFEQLSGLSQQRKGRAALKKLKRQEKMESLLQARQEVMDKSEVHLHHGFTEMIIMMLSKVRQEESEICDELITRYLVQYTSIIIIQISMCALMISNILTDGSHYYDYTLYVTTFYTVVLAKFICSAALHLMLYPEIANTMVLMKYINNHMEDFKHPTLAFTIAHTSHVINLVAEFLNIYMLAYQHTVEHCIIHFVALEIIVEIPHIYMGSLIDDKMKERIFQNNSHLHVKNKACDISFWENRGFISKTCRVIYKWHRACYVSVLFYFAPYITILVYLGFVTGGHFPEHH